MRKKDVSEALEGLKQPEEKPKHAGGRPKKITIQMAEKIFRLAAKGFVDEEIAEILDISSDTIYRAKKSTEFCGAIAQAKDEADAAVINSLFQRAIGYSHPEEKVFCNEGSITTHNTVKHYPPDSAAGIFWLTNRRREEWRREIQKEDTSDRKPPIVRLFSRVAQEDIQVINRGDNQVDVLLGKDFVEKVKETRGLKQPNDQ